MDQILSKVQDQSGANCFLGSSLSDAATEFESGLRAAFFVQMFLH